MRVLHRWIGPVIAPLAVWIAVTGAVIQIVDLTALSSVAPATDPNLMAIRESIDGPPNQQVISTGDYAAPSFAADYDFASALRRVVEASRRRAPTDAIRYVELRAGPLGAEGDVKVVDRVMRFGADGSVLADAINASPAHVSSAHDTMKHLHRLFFLGDDMLWINALVGLGLAAMIFTGLVVYGRLLIARARIGRRAIIWSGGGAWRALHRGVGICAAAFLLVIAISGTVLSLDSLAFGIYRGLYPGSLVGGFSPVGTVGDYSRPLATAELMPMLKRVIAAYRATDNRPIKVIRLRYFAGMPQGVVVAGSSGEASQSIFNAVTGQRAGLSGPNYPYTGFPLGWEWHEWMKKLHRGDAFGITGRVMSLLSAIALVFMIASGAVTYVDLLGRRRKAGRRAMFWK